MAPRPDQTDWHLDKKISIGIILSLMANFFAGSWFASKLDSRVGSLEDATKNSTQVFERMIRVETQLEGLKDTVNRIDQSVAKIVDRERK